jgi:hypothetical protein
VKHSVFMWAWNNYPLTLDKLMTRQRAAKLLRSWRRASRFEKYSIHRVDIVRIGLNEYRITKDGESATMKITRSA